MSYDQGCSTVMFKAFPLMRKNTEAWESLLDLNGGRSAPWITEAPGQNHDLYVCCLLLTSELKRKKPEGQNSFAEGVFRNEEWSAYYSRIAIIVPVAIQSGIAMAQGIKRLCDTCPCDHLKQLGITLLAHTVKYFNTEYLFLSPIDPFRKHLRRELYVNGVPYGDVEYRSLCWAMRENEGRAGPVSTWLDIRSRPFYFTERDQFRCEDGVMVKITPQACPAVLKESDYRTGKIVNYQAKYITGCRRPECRVLLLNKGYYIENCDDNDEDYQAPRPLPLETHDFLWFIAGDGVMVVHGPSLATLISEC